MNSMQSLLGGGKFMEERCWCDDPEYIHLDYANTVEEVLKLPHRVDYKLARLATQVSS